MIETAVTCGSPCKGQYETMNSCAEDSMKLCSPVMDNGNLWLMSHHEKGGAKLGVPV